MESKNIDAKVAERTFSENKIIHEDIALPPKIRNSVRLRQIIPRAVLQRRKLLRLVRTRLHMELLSLFSYDAICLFTHFRVQLCSL